MTKKQFLCACVVVFGAMAALNACKTEKKPYGEPVWEDKQSDESCPCYITNTGYILILHLDGDTVTAIDLYDQDPTPTTIRSNG